jgi:hypothetical protein
MPAWPPLRWFYMRRGAGILTCDRACPASSGRLTGDRCKLHQ